MFPGAGCFTVTHDEAKLKDYQFGARSMTHRVSTTGQSKTG